MNPQNIVPNGVAPQPGQPTPTMVAPSYAPSAATSVPQVDANGQYTVVPPLQPSAPSAATGYNPYEFIMHDNVPKQHLFGGSSLLQRVLMIGGGLVLLVIIAAIAMSLLTPKNTAIPTFTSLAQEQQEIIRVTTDMMQSASSSDLKNAATTTNLAVTSDQKQFVSYLAANKVKLNQKQLALKLDATNTQLLSSAKATSTYDAAATKLLQNVLATYQTDLKTARTTIHGTKSGPLLDKAIATDGLLVTQAAAIGN